MFLQSSKALCCLNKVHLWDNKALEDTWCWFELNGFSMAHIPRSVSPISFFYFILFLFLSPHFSPFSPHSPLHSSSAVIYYSSIQHFGSVTVWSWADLGFAHLGMSSSERAGGPLISQDLFQSFEGGRLWGYMREERRSEEWKPSSLKPWREDQALHAKATPEPRTLDDRCIKGVVYMR